MNRPHLLVVDGMALLFRSFFATSIHKQFMFNENGVPTNAVQGYLRHLLMAVNHIHPTHVVVSWDMGSHTFRNDLFNGYKANRDAPPSEMLPQFDLAKQATTAFQLTNIGIVGFEADDCIGSICARYKDQLDISVLTGDRDLLQVVDDNVHVYLLQKGMGNYKQYTKQVFVDEYDLLPHQLIDVKALMGDSSDGYPGVKGIGEKTALKLIQTHQSIDQLLENMNQLTQGQQTKITENLDLLHLSYELATIRCDVPVELNVDDAIWNGVHDQAVEFIHSHGLKVVRNFLRQHQLVPTL